MPHIMTKRL